MILDSTKMIVLFLHDHKDDVNADDDDEGGLKECSSPGYSEF